MILFKYVLRDYFKFVIGTVVLCMFLFIMFDFIHKTTKYFAEHEPSMMNVFQFYAYQIPMHLTQALPIASLLASVITMVLLSRTNEITAMRAAGMGPLRVGLPIAAGGIILSLGSFLIGEFIAPHAAKRMRYVQQVLIEGRNPSEVNQGARWMRRNNELIHFDDYEPLSQVMTNVRIIETGANFRPKQTIEAAQAIYQAGNKVWRLEKVKVLYFNPNGTLAYTEERDAQLVEIPVEPSKIEKERRKPSELSLFELYDFIDRGKNSGTDISEYQVEMHVKFAFHFAAFVVCLMGLKFGYRSERTVETAKGVLLAISVGLSYWFFLNAGKALGKRGTLPPFFAAWIANVAVFSIGIFDLYRVRKTR